MYTSSTDEYQERSDPETSRSQVVFHIYPVKFTHQLNMNIKKDQVLGPVGPKLSFIFILYKFTHQLHEYQERSGPGTSRSQVVFHLYPVQFTRQLHMNIKKDHILEPVGPKLSFIFIQYNLHTNHI